MSITNQERDRLVELARMARDADDHDPWYDFVEYVNLLVAEDAPEATAPRSAAESVAARVDAQVRDIKEHLNAEKDIALATIRALTGAIVLLDSIDPYAGGESA